MTMEEPPNKQRKIKNQENIDSSRSRLNDLHVDSDVRLDVIRVGTKQFEMRTTSNTISKLYTYLEHCFDSLLVLIENGKEIAIDSEPYTIILQFIYSIAEYSSLLNHKRPDSDRHTFIINGAQYKVLTSPTILRSECVWYEHGIFYFHDCLIKQALKNSSQEPDINIESSLRTTPIHTPDIYSLATDVVVLKKQLLPKLAILFSIAQHAVQHMVESDADFINHSHWTNPKVYTTSSAISIKLEGKLENVTTMLDHLENNLEDDLLYKI